MVGGDWGWAALPDKPDRAGFTERDRSDMHKGYRDKRRPKGKRPRRREVGEKEVDLTVGRGESVGSSRS